MGTKLVSYDLFLDSNWVYKYVTYLEKWTLSAAHLSYNGSDVSFFDIQVDIMQLFAFTPSKGSFSYLDYIWIIFNLTFNNIRIDFL